MLTLSNALSFMRGPLALLLFIERTDVRIFAIVAAMLSDSFDGYLARRYNTPTKFGAILDPLMDKIFVFIALYIFTQEGRLQFVESCFMLSRDFALAIFGIYLIATHTWKTYAYGSVRWGKVTTALQFCFLFLLSLDHSLPFASYTLFVVVGIFVLMELFFVQQPLVKKD